MTKQLWMHAITKFLAGFVLVGILVFLPAGTIFFYNGWIFMFLLFVPMFIGGIALAVKNPPLLKKRLDAKEQQVEQRVIVVLSALVFIAGFLIAGFNFRFGWHSLPMWLVTVASAVFLAAYALYARVLYENAYLSRTISVQENQTVVDTGLYSVVRHPMYLAVLVLFLSMPLVLGSIFSFFIFLILPIIFVLRIQYEEAYLVRELPGYSAYRQKVKYRLIPFIW